MQPNPAPDTDFPWWLVILGVIGALLFWQVLSSDVYSAALAKLAKRPGQAHLAPSIAANGGGHAQA